MYPFFPSVFSYTPSSTYERLPFRASMPRCRGRPYIPYMLPISLLPVMEHRLSHPATELTNGALRRRNSGYFGYCNSHHLPYQTDLVIIELDTEDESCVSFFLSFLFRFFRASSVSFVPLPFLPFLFRFFRFSSVSSVSLPFLSYHPFSFRFCSLSVCCDRLAPTLHMPFYRHPPKRRTFPHQPG